METTRQWRQPVTGDNPSKENKTPSGPVKSIPKDFSDANPVKRDKPSQRRQIQSMETKSVKSILEDFSEAKPVNGDKIS